MLLTSIGAILAIALPQTPDDAQVLESFQMLRSTQKAMLVARVRGRLASSGNAALARIQALGVDFETLPESEAPPTFDPARWAPGQAPARTTVSSRDPKHAAVVKRFARTPFLADLHAAVRYDWCRGTLTQRGWPLGYDEVFENMLRGYAPGSDQAVAQVMAKLDTEATPRKLAWWFGHTYADLEARSFDGVTLYDAWYSGEIVDVPDVDAVPFAHEILDQKSLRSPLSGRPRDRLYQAIQLSSLIYRKYRTAREAAAAAFVRDAPSMDATYARLVPRFHYLFATHDDSLEAIAEVLTASDRDALIEDIDLRVSDPDDDAYELRESRRQELAELARLVRDSALAELEFFTR